MGDDCCKNVYFVFVTPSVSVSLSLSLSLQEISLFYMFKTYSNDSEVFSEIEINNVDLAGAFTTTGMFSHPKSIP